MTDLTHDAQAVLDAYTAKASIYPTTGIAAALRAAADQVVPSFRITPQEDLENRREAMEWGMRQQTQITRQELLAIADQLETL